MRPFRLLSVVVALSVAGGLVAWYVWHSIPVSVVVPARGSAAEIVYASGVVEPLTWAKVTPLVRERIVEQCNCEGATVKTGDILARLDDSEARAALAELEARLALAEQEFRRYNLMLEKNTAAQQSVDRASSEVQQLKALAVGQRARLDSYIIRAPIDGVVLRQDGEVGEVADLGTALFWVGEQKPLLVVADVNEEDIPRLRLGQKALLKSDAFKDQTLNATVSSITPKGDPVTKTYRVKLRLPDDTPLMIGMSTDVNVIVRVSENALLVPTVAVQAEKVFTVEGNSARLREIKAGIRGPSGIEIRSGLDEQARVISPFPQDLKDGAWVTITGAAK
ncbi:RND family efflux transporter, MFP subunit [Rhizobium mongolense subsp. loessense]|uniref:RND family efflux transporter, MFP subunit n=1 Tax=Rhizobium mongolense subsp. loessense TaxID=158890 RepID=A0A1G4TK20_9HYPH|nr:efflux RND transporter periplasmic adaptor subunit [Rhizobium mongolense]SCW80939.1 RND family efflux transporter, MFP subunit [Rhizobium mongolense subsp. loessense]